LEPSVRVIRADLLVHCACLISLSPSSLTQNPLDDLSTLHRLEPQSQFRLAVGSYIEQYNNAVQVLKTRMALPPGAEYPSMQIYCACEIEHPYPCTKILWSPDAGGGTGGHYGGRDLLATTGDYLRLWSVSDEGGEDGAQEGGAFE